MLLFFELNYLFYLKDYIIFIYFLIFSLFFSFLLHYLSFRIAPQKFKEEKNSGYECGYEPFEDARTCFDIQFYLVSILFLIFDIEIAYLFPLVVNFNNFILLAIFNANFFLIFLALGFYYEYKKSAIIW